MGHLRAGFLQVDQDGPLLQARQEAVAYEYQRRKVDRHVGVQLGLLVFAWAGLRPDERYGRDIDLLEDAGGVYRYYQGVVFFQSAFS